MTVEKSKVLSGFFGREAVPGSTWLLSRGACSDRWPGQDRANNIQPGLGVRAEFAQSSHARALLECATGIFEIQACDNTGEREVQDMVLI